MSCRLHPLPARRLPAALVGSVVLALAGCGGGGGAAPFVPPPPPAPVAGAQAAQIGAAALVGDTSTAFQFFGQSTEANGDTVDYAWDFDDDGTTDSTSQSPQHTFASTGAKTVRLTVTDNGGRVNTAEAVVGVFDAPGLADPAVTLHAWMLHGAAGCEIFLRASAVDPDGGAIASYEWDFDGDGTTDQTGASPTTVRTFPDADTLRPEVTAVDDDGARSTAAATIVICEAGDYPDGAPAAMIDVPGGSLLVATNTALDLAAVGSDLDGGALGSAEWDLDGDGTFGDLSGREISPTFATEGLRRVRVRLTDDEGGAPNEAEVHVLVQDAAAPAGPTAWAWSEALVVAPNTAVQLHGRATDPEGQTLTFSWDIDGDGTEDSSATDPLFTFTLPGIYRPRLQVSDTDGNVSTSDLTLLVERCDDTTAPYFRYAGDDLVFLHGGAPQLVLTGAGPGAADSYQLLYKAGTPAEDPSAADLTVADHTGQSLPPATTLVAVPGGGTVPLDLLSTAVDGPARLACYTVGVRLVDAGVRVQVLQCQACVVHEAVTVNWIVFPFTDEYGGWLQVAVDPTLVPGLQATLPDVYEVEMLFNDFTPALVEMGAPFLMHPGWSEASVAGGHRLFTTTNPIPPTGATYGWQFRYDTSSGAGLGPAVTAGRVNLRDADGALIGAQTFTVP